MNAILISFFNHIYLKTQTRPGNITYLDVQTEYFLKFTEWFSRNFYHKSNGTYITVPLSELDPVLKGTIDQLFEHWVIEVLKIKIEVKKMTYQEYVVDSGSLSDKVRLLKQWVSRGELVSKFENRSDDDLHTLLNQLELAIDKLPKKPLT